MSKILSGEELVHAHAKTNHELPAAGIKDFQPTNSWLEEKQIQNALEQRKILLEEERVEKRNCLMEAMWVPEKHKAEVKQRGKHWEVFGHHSDNTDWLFPEEVLFLMETNCLECLFDEVPLSIQKAYTVLLQNSFSLNEYRVFAHLCRMGYRVVRHLPNLTVTAYERQIRLDQHLDQREMCSRIISSESEVPRPDLPPKKIVDLPENTEISIESGSVAFDSEHKANFQVSGVVKNKPQVVHKPIEVIDLIDSSPENSSSDDSPSDDSDIEIIHQSTSVSQSRQEINVELSDDDDSDVEIIDMPVQRKEIIVATIESSDSEQENDISNSDSDKSYDGNWKRNQASKKNRQHVRPILMRHFKFSAIEEFCLERPVDEAIHERIQPINEEDRSISNGDVDNSNSVDYLSLEPLPAGRARPLYPVNKSRYEILDLMPTMAGLKSKIMTLEIPDLRLIPDRIIPKQQSYTFNTNSLRARVFSSFRPNFQGHRTTRLPRFLYNGSNHFFNPTNVNNYYVNQSNPMNSLLQTQSLTQMFGSDIHSMARGMMQFASTLMSNFQQDNSQTNGLLPYNPQTNMSVFSPYQYSQFSSSPQQQCERPLVGFTTQNHNRFSNLSLGSSSSIVMNENVQRPFRDRSFGTERSYNSRSSGADSDFDSSERTFISPDRRIHKPFINNTKRGNFFRRPFGRRSSYNQREINSPAPPTFSPMSQNPRAIIDPAYVKPDVPLVKDQNIPNNGSGDFIPLKGDTSPIEIIKVIDKKNDLVVRKGISSRFQQRQKRKHKQQRRRLAKRQKFQNEKGTPISTPEIIFLDSPISSNDDDLVPVKHENDGISDDNIITDTLNETSILKQEMNENNKEIEIKRETGADTRVKTERNIDGEKEKMVKSEGNNEVKVKLEQHASEPNLRVEIKVESHSDTSSLNGVPITSLVEEEIKIPIKTELCLASQENADLSSITMKTESIVDSAHVKIENLLEGGEIKTESVENTTPSIDSEMSGIKSETNVELNAMETETSDEIDNDSSRSIENQNSDLLNSNDMEIVSGNSKTVQNTNNELQNKKNSNRNISTWAEVKKHNVLIVSFQESQDEKENDSDDCGNDNDIDHIQPLIKPKHCKTIETVLSALQIFSPFTANVTEFIPKLKISFDMYLPADFRKSQRGLPQYRIVVFGGMDSLPSPAQLFELQNRFEDSVPLLRAVVMPDSVVFYSCSNISLPVDVTSYTE